MSESGTVKTICLYAYVYHMFTKIISNHPAGYLSTHVRDPHNVIPCSSQSSFGRSKNFHINGAYLASISFPNISHDR